MEPPVDASSPITITDESSLRYEGWRIVAVCFLVATFGWAFRLLRAERLSRRAAPCVRLAGFAGIGRDHFLLSVRRAARRLRCGGGAKIQPAQLPDRRHA